MTRKSQLRMGVLAVCMSVATAWTSAHAQEIPVVTGALWTASAEPVKKAYLVGIANAIQVETAYEGANPPADGQRYAANPDKLQRAVIETIWFEMVVPGLAKNK